MAVAEALQLLPGGVGQRVDVLDLLHGEHVEVHLGDAPGDPGPGHFGLALDQAALVAAQLQLGRVVEAEGGTALDLDVVLVAHLGREVEAGEQVVEVEGANLDAHRASVPLCP